MRCMKPIQHLIIFSETDTLESCTAMNKWFEAGRTRDLGKEVNMVNRQISVVRITGERADQEV